MSRREQPMEEMLDEIDREPYLPPMIAATAAMVGLRWTTSGDNWASREAVTNGWRWMREQQVERDRRGGR
jgi:hypothetical protein